jgi:hypothetical protein
MQLLTPSKVTDSDDVVAARETGAVLLAEVVTNTRDAAEHLRFIASAYKAR